MTSLSSDSLIKAIEEIDRYKNDEIFRNEILLYQIMTSMWHDKIDLKMSFNNCEKTHEWVKRIRDRISRKLKAARALKLEIKKLKIRELSNNF